MGKVGNLIRWEVGRGDGEGLGRSGELNGIGWGDTGWWEVGLGDGEVLMRSVEFDGARRSPEGNDEARREQSLCLLLAE